MKDSYIMTGDLVMVSYPSTDGFNNPAKKLHGQKFVVKNIHRFRDKSKNVTRRYYELYQAESDMGMPYVFLDDELIKL